MTHRICHLIEAWLSAVNFVRKGVYQKRVDLEAAVLEVHVPTLRSGTGKSSLIRVWHAGKVGQMCRNGSRSVSAGKIDDVMRFELVKKSQSHCDNVVGTSCVQTDKPQKVI